MEKNEPKYMNSNLIFILHIQSAQRSSDKGLELLGRRLNLILKNLKATTLETEILQLLVADLKLDSYQ